MGRKVKVEKGLPGFWVEAIQTYRGEPKRPVLWRGKLLFGFENEQLFEIECHLVDGQKGRFIGWPTRTYEDDAGDTKHHKYLFMHSDALQGAAREAAEFEAGLVTDDDVSARRSAKPRDDDDRFGDPGEFNSPYERGDNR